MRFTKMHGIGNDYLFLDALAEPAILLRTDLPQLARRMSDRRSGIGSDGVIILLAPQKGMEADFAMRIFNADGSEGGICGNGARCAAKLAVDRGYVVPGATGAMTIAVGGRLLAAKAAPGPDGVVSEITIDMGPPSFELAACGVDPKGVGLITDGASGAAGNGEYRVGLRVASFVSMGNPHMVAFIDEPLETVALHQEGPMFERHPAFKDRMNYHIVNVLSKDAVVVRTWERGSGITHGCGSGACAVVAAGAHTGRTSRQLRVHMVGGDLELHWDERSGHVLKTGPATEVFNGEWSLTSERSEPLGSRR